jgi:hypothetical protein
MPARPLERVKKKKKTRRKMANRNQSRFEEERRRHEDRASRVEQNWDLRRGSGIGRGVVSPIRSLLPPRPTFQW